MKRDRFSDEQIIGILKEQEAGSVTADVCRRHAVSEATFYKWKARFGGLEVSEAKSRRPSDDLLLAHPGSSARRECQRHPPSEPRRSRRVGQRQTHARARQQPRLQSLPLSLLKSGRALLPQAQTFPCHRHALRKTRRQLPRARQTRSCQNLDAVHESVT